MFDRSDYIKKELWKDSEYLVDATTAIKTCPCCERERYSSEFASVPEYVDGKFPVCTQCFTGKKTSDAAREIVEKNLEIRICRKCDGEFSILNFADVLFDSWGISQKCTDCSSKK